jgi:hypothetical protein
MARQSRASFARPSPANHEEDGGQLARLTHPGGAVPLRLEPSKVAGKSSEKHGKKASCYLHVDTDDFPVIAGIVQFEPRVRGVNGRTVREIKVRAFGRQQEYYITVWPEYGHVPLAKGDFVVVQGKRRTWEGNDREGNRRQFSGVSAKTLTRVAPAQPKCEPEPVF